MVVWPVSPQCPAMSTTTDALCGRIADQCSSGMPQDIALAVPVYCICGGEEMSDKHFSHHKPCPACVSEARASGVVTTVTVMTGRGGVCLSVNKVSHSCQALQANLPGCRAVQHSSGNSCEVPFIVAIHLICMVH